MSTMSTKEAARGFSEVVSRVAYGRERLVLTRRSPLAAIISIAELEELESRQAARRGPRRRHVNEMQKERELERIRLLNAGMTGRERLLYQRMFEPPTSSRRRPSDEGCRPRGKGRQLQGVVGDRSGGSTSVCRTSSRRRGGTEHGLFGREAIDKARKERDRTGEGAAGAQRVTDEEQRSSKLARQAAIDSRVKQSDPTHRASQAGRGSNDRRRANRSARGSGGIRRAALAQWNKRPGGGASLLGSGV